MNRIYYNKQNIADVVMQKAFNDTFHVTNKSVSNPFYC